MLCNGPNGSWKACRAGLAWSPNTAEPVAGKSASGTLQFHEIFQLFTDENRFGNVKKGEIGRAFDVQCSYSKSWVCGSVPMMGGVALWRTIITSGESGAFYMNYA